MISILTTLSCVMVALCMILGLMMISPTCQSVPDHLKDMNVPLKGIPVSPLEALIVAISLEFYCLVISGLCIGFSSLFTV